MKNKKPLYAGIAAIVIATAILLSAKTEKIGESIDVVPHVATSTLQVKLPQVAESQNVEYAITFNEIIAERQNQSGKDVIMVVHQRTKGNLSFDYLVQFRSIVDDSLAQMDRGTVFLGTNVNVSALNIIEGERKDDGYEIEVVMEGKTLVIPVLSNGVFDQVNMRIK